MALKSRSNIRTLGEYKAEPELKRQLATLEKSVQQGFSEASAQHTARLSPTPVIRSDYQSKPDELVLCDPSGGAFAVLLPSAGSGDAGMLIVVKNTTTSSNTITVRPPGGVRVNAGQMVLLSASLTTAWFCFDGNEWWKL